MPLDPGRLAGISAVIFDCDGVLVDSEILACRIDAELFAEHGLDLPPEEIARRYVGLKWAEMARRIGEEFGVILPEALAQECARRFDRAIDEGLAAVPGIEPVVAALATLKCVASSSAERRIRRSLAATGLLGHFGEAIYSAEHVEHGKPAPDLFLHAARSIGAQPDACLVIEDSPFGIAAARAAGMLAVGFTGGSHCTEATASVLVDSGADAVAGDAGGLSEVLRPLFAAGRQARSKLSLRFQ